jgi:hypothetical protein
LSKDGRLSCIVEDGNRSGDIAWINRVQNKRKTYTGIVPGGGIGNKLVEIPSSGFFSGFFQEGDTIERHRFRRLDNRRSCHGTAARIGVLGHIYLQILLAQICTRRKWQIDACIVIGVTRDNDSLRWIFKLEAIFKIGESQPIARG